MEHRKSNREYLHAFVFRTPVLSPSHVSSASAGGGILSWMCQPGKLIAETDVEFFDELERLVDSLNPTMG